MFEFVLNGLYMSMCMIYSYVIVSSEYEINVHLSRIILHRNIMDYSLQYKSQLVCSIEYF